MTTRSEYQWDGERQGRRRGCWWWWWWWWREREENNIRDTQTRLIRRKTSDVLSRFNSSDTMADNNSKLDSRGRPYGFDIHSSHQSNRWEMAKSRMQGAERKQRSMQMIAYFPSSSFRSYSSVKRVVVVMMLANGILLVTVAILLVDVLAVVVAVVVVVIGDDTFGLLLSFVGGSLFLLFVLFLFRVLRNLLKRTLLYFIQLRTCLVDQKRMNEYEEADVGSSSWEEEEDESSRSTCVYVSDMCCINAAKRTRFFSLSSWSFVVMVKAAVTAAREKKLISGRRHTQRQNSDADSGGEKEKEREAERKRERQRRKDDDEEEEEEEDEGEGERETAVAEKHDCWGRVGKLDSRQCLTSQSQTGRRRKTGMVGKMTYKCTIIRRKKTISENFTGEAVIKISDEKSLDQTFFLLSNCFVFNSRIAKLMIIRINGSSRLQTSFAIGQSAKTNRKFLSSIATFPRFFEIGSGCVLEDDSFHQSSLTIKSQSPIDQRDRVACSIIGCFAHQIYLIPLDTNEHSRSRRILTNCGLLFASSRNSRSTSQQAVDLPWSVRREHPVFFIYLLKTEITKNWEEWSIIGID